MKWWTLLTNGSKVGQVCIQLREIGSQLSHSSQPDIFLLSLITTKQLNYGRNWTLSCKISTGIFLERSERSKVWSSCLIFNVQIIWFMGLAIVVSRSYGPTLQMLKVDCLWFLSSTESTIITNALLRTVACDPARMSPLRQCTAWGNQRHSSTGIDWLFKCTIGRYYSMWGTCGNCDSYIGWVCWTGYPAALQNSTAMSSHPLYTVPQRLVTMIAKSMPDTGIHAQQTINLLGMMRQVFSNPGLHFIFVPCIAGKSHHCLFIQTCFLFTPNDIPGDFDDMYMDEQSLP